MKVGSRRGRGAQPRSGSRSHQKGRSLQSPFLWTDIKQTDMDFMLAVASFANGADPSRPATRLSAEQLRFIYVHSPSRPTGRGERTVDACYVRVTGIEGDERSKAVIGLHALAAFPFY